MSVLQRPKHVEHSADRAADFDPWPLLVGATLVAVLLPTASYVLGVYDHVQHWGKVVHAVDGFCIALVFGALSLGWRDYEQIDMTDELAGLVTVFVGIVVGVLSEIVAFIRDWIADSDLQKSNTDTMTDFLCNDVAVVVGALIAVRMMSRLTSERQRSVGQTAEWIVDGPSRLLDRHGGALGVFAAMLIVASVASLWFAGRPVPGIPIP